MYSKPTVQKFGSFRELTQIGLSNASDGVSIWGISGCETFGVEIGCPVDPSAS